MLKTKVTKKRIKPEYANPKLVNKMFEQFGIPEAEFEYHLYVPGHSKPYRFDIAWSNKKVALEIQGAIWKGSAGGHTSGKGIKSNWIKYNYAAQTGWRIIYCEPSEWTSDETFETIKKTLAYRRPLTASII